MKTLAAFRSNYRTMRVELSSRIFRQLDAGLVQGGEDAADQSVGHGEQDPVAGRGVEHPRQAVGGLGITGLLRQVLAALEQETVDKGHIIRDGDQAHGSPCFLIVPALRSPLRS